jgi:hypothetical protein
VDPTTFDTAVVAPESELEQLSSRELRTLIQGLNVRIRSAAGGVQRRPPTAPGPGAYVPRPAFSSVGPRWQADAVQPSAADRAAKILPGPGEYGVPLPPAGTRKFQIQSRLQSVDEVRCGRFPQPGPAQYEPKRPPTTRSYKIATRDCLREPVTSTSQPGPCSYLEPASTFSPRPANATQSPRFPQLTSVAPGPGYYDVPGMQPRQMAFSARRKGYH